jgi:hypothetical protein
MPIDSTIPLQVRSPDIENPQNVLMRMLQMQGAQRDNELGQMKADEYRRGVDRSNRLDQILQSGSDPKKLRESGYLKESLDWEERNAKTAKEQADAEKAHIEAAHKQLDAIGQVSGWLQQNPSIENATLALQHLQRTGAITPDSVQQYQAQFQADPTPQGIARIASMAYRSALGTKDQLMKTETRNTGGTTDTLGIDPVTGQTRTLNSARNTQSPDNAATNETSRANNAATVGATIRGQDLTDARSREATSASMTKPFEITGEDGRPVLVQQDKTGRIVPVQGYGPKQGASKPLTDTQAKALQFGSRMQAAEDTIGELAGKGAVTSIPGSRGGFGVGTAINALQPADQQRLDQAKRDFINAVLRRESGAAISAGEFDNAEKQYFPQPGEKDPGLLAQKKRNRDLATRGILAEVPDSDARVAKVRGAAPAGKTIKRTGTAADGRKVVEYSDGSIDYAN